FNEQTLERARRNMRLAERLGAEAITVTGEHPAEEIIAIARRRGVTKIVIGKPSRARWREWFHRSAVDELIRLSGDIDVHVVKGEPEVDDTTIDRPVAARVANNWREYALALAVN